MKNTIFSFLAVLLFCAASAQSTSDSIASKYKLIPMPEALTLERAFPIIGQYQLTGAEAAPALTVTIDSINKGIVWVEGLPQGRVKAYLKQSPATYRIMAQKTASGESVPEGTLIFDPSTNTMNIALGKAYNEADPAEVFTALNAAVATDAIAPGSEVKVKSKSAAGKSKAKVTFYTATKAGGASMAGNSLQQ